MKITGIHTDQFAGIRDKDVSLKEGINVIYGPNEAGKSTLVNLLSRVLFEGKRPRKGSDFQKNCFPGERKDGASGDVIDGMVTFETDQGTFQLEKEWDKEDREESRARLSTPHGVFKKDKDIDAELKKVLKYGEGVYNDLLLSSQANTGDVLKSLIDEGRTGSGDRDILSGTTKAFAQSDGIPIASIEAAIQSHVNELAGSYWDMTQNRPVNKPGGGRWQKGIGTVLAAYYRTEDCKKELRDLNEKLDASEKAQMAYEEAVKPLRNAEERYRKFMQYASVIARHTEQQQRKKELKSRSVQLRKNALAWRTAAENLSKADLLSQEKKDRDAEDLWQSAGALNDDILRLKQQLRENGNPDSEDVRSLEDTERKLETIDSQLRGLNILAGIHLQDGYSLRVTSLLTGKPLHPDGDILLIREAVRIEVPGVMTMDLTPSSVNLEELNRQKKLLSDRQRKIREKYGAASSEQLRTETEKAREIIRRMESREEDLKRTLNGKSMDEVTEIHAGIKKEPRSMKDLLSDIHALGQGDIEVIQAGFEAAVRNYESQYGNLESLQQEIAKTDHLLSQLEQDETEDIPDEFRNITDAGLVQSELEAAKDRAEQKYKEAYQRKTETRADLNAFQESLDQDPNQALQDAQTELDEEKEKLKHWCHIRSVFEEEKSRTASRPIQDLEDSFARYLNLLSGGTIVSEFPDQNDLKMSVYSRDFRMNYGRLSEGTRDTVSLAFRLAVLDHLFPDGGGLMALDDPFADMDEKRTEAACRLVKEAAKKHQILFLTCRKEMAEMLSDEVIEWR